MNYELATKLKEAGFPQGIDPERLIYPTLAELITACGSKFFYVSKLTGYNAFPENQEKPKLLPWGAKGLLENPEKYTEMFLGSTPEEAVANLWLELNKK